jgi:hypothetical protein
MSFAVLFVENRTTKAFHAAAVDHVSGPFRPEHHWIGYTPAMRIKSNVTGDAATLYFECLWMDVDSNAIGAHAFS